MDWVQVSTIVGVNGGLIAVLATLIIWAVNKLDGDIKSISTRLDVYDKKFEAHSQRIDQLYTVIISILEKK